MRKILKFPENLPLNLKFFYALTLLRLGFQIFFFILSTVAIFVGYQTGIYEVDQFFLGYLETVFPGVRSSVPFMLGRLTALMAFPMVLSFFSLKMLHQKKKNYFLATLVLQLLLSSDIFTTFSSLLFIIFIFAVPNNRKFFNIDSKNMSKTKQTN